MAGAFSRKTSGISCDLTAFRKIKEHRANAVETLLGVTGLLGTPKFGPYGRAVAWSAVTAQVTVIVPSLFIQAFIYIQLRTNHSYIYTQLLCLSILQQWN